MRITHEQDYAFRIVVFFTNNDNELSSAQIVSNNINVPLRFTLKILRKLNLAGITTAKRGATGGYMLKKDPSKINLYDVYLAISGPIELNGCTGVDRDCTLNVMNTCEVRKILESVQDDLINRFKSVTFDKVKSKN